MSAQRKRASSRINPEVLGKDEMNLLEYCVFSATPRVDRTTKSIVIEEQHTRPPRRLTAAFSAEYGRPTSRDDQVLLALLKLTRDKSFDSRRVDFTRYEVLGLLGWPKTGHYYRMVGDALYRIRGTTLIWENAFWDHGARERVTRNFSILDEVVLLDREESMRLRTRLGVENAKSSILWSEVLFDSFESGYIKSVDFGTLRAIEGDVAKRLFRWIDKRFGHPTAKGPVQLPLEQLAVNKLGFKRKPSSHLRRMVAPAIAELERLRIVRADASRFYKSGGQTWVRFERPQTGSTRTRRVDPTLARKLAERGVSAEHARRLAAESPDESTRQLEAFDARRNGGWRPHTSSGGYLRNAIEKRQRLPEGFQTLEQRQAMRLRRLEASAETRRSRDRERAESEQSLEAARARKAAVEAWKVEAGDDWPSLERKVFASLSPSEQQRFLLSDIERVRLLYGHRPKCGPS